MYLSEERLKAVDPFYLMSMPGEVKDPTQGVNMYPVVNSHSGVISICNPSCMHGANAPSFTGGRPQ